MTLQCIAKVELAASFMKAISQHCLHTDCKWCHCPVSQAIVILKLKTHLQALQSSHLPMHGSNVWCFFCCDIANLLKQAPGSTFFRWPCFFCQSPPCWSPSCQTDLIQMNERTAFFHIGLKSVWKWIDDEVIILSGECWFPVVVIWQPFHMRIIREISHHVECFLLTEWEGSLPGVLSVPDS